MKNIPVVFTKKDLPAFVCFAAVYLFFKFLSLGEGRGGAGGGPTINWLAGVVVWFFSFWVISHVFSFIKTALEQKGFSKNKLNTAFHFIYITIIGGIILWVFVLPRFMFM